MFQTFSALVKVPPIPHAIFETKRWGFIRILHYCSVLWKITPLYMCTSDLVCFGQKEPIEKKLSDFWVFGWKFTKFLKSYLKPKVSFSLNFLSLVSVMLDTLLYFFRWNFIWFRQKELIKVQNFRLSTAHVKFHQICTLIGSFCWKYIKCQLKTYRQVTSYENEEWFKIWRKTDLLFQKWQEFGKFWPEHSKFSKFPLWLFPFVQSI